MQIKQEPIDPDFASNDLDNNSKPKVDDDNIYVGIPAKNTDCRADQLPQEILSLPMKTCPVPLMASSAFSETIPNESQQQQEISHSLPKRINLIQEKISRDHCHVQLKQKPKVNNTMVINQPSIHSGKTTERELKKPVSLETSSKRDLIRDFNRPEDEAPSMNGLFGWAQISNVFIPYIFREDNERYVCVRILEQKILNTYPNVFPEELAMREPLTSSFIRPNEIQIFNRLLRMQYKNKLPGFSFNTDDVVVILEDFLDFFKIVQNAFPCFKDKPQHVDNPRNRKPSVRSGWTQVNNTVIPYICRANIKFVPQAVLKHAALINIKSDGYEPTDYECRELNDRCALEGFNFTFKNTTKLVRLADVEKLPDVKVIDLPDKNPLMFTQYIQNEDKEQDGLKLNVTRTGIPHDTLNQSDNNYRNVCQTMYQSYLNQDNLPTGHCKPSNSQIPQDYRFHHASTKPDNSENQSKTQAKNGYYDHQQPCLNTIPNGQNINVNYGINIQNITPVSHFKPNNNTELNGQNVFCPQWHQGHPSFQHGGDPRMQFSQFNTQNMCHNQFPNPQSMPRVDRFPQSMPLEDQSKPCLKRTLRTMNNAQQSTASSNQANNEIQSQPNQPPANFYERQKQAVIEIKARIKGLWLCGKNISCLQRGTNKFCLVEAVCKLYFGNTTVSHFLFTIDNVLPTYTCTEIEEQAFIEYYQLPVKTLKCNKMVELSAFERLYSKLTELFCGASSPILSHTSPRCLLPMVDHQKQEPHQHQCSHLNQGQEIKDHVIVLDGSP